MSKCCINCFIDHEIQEIITSKDTKGDCSFCGSSEVYVFDLGKDKDLENLFEEFISIYTKDSLGNPESDLLKNFLKNDWSIFNESLDTSEVQELIEAICPLLKASNRSLFYESLIIQEQYDEDHLNSYGIFKGYDWDDFSKGIRKDIRFHSDFLNYGVFKNYLEHCQEEIDEGEIFYRARISNGDDIYGCEDMGSPESKDAKGGRANPKGIPYLYLGSDKETVLYEIRAGKLDSIFIGEFKCSEKIMIINLENLHKISPFRINESKSEYLNHAINNRHLKRISDEISKPIKKSVEELEYLPTQYICEFIKILKYINEKKELKNYAGIKYKSSIGKDGFNLAIFDENVFECINVNNYTVKDIQYSYNKC